MGPNDFDRRTMLEESVRQPLLRPVEAREAFQEGVRFIVLSDPSQVARGPVALTPSAVAVASRFDGERSIEEIQADLEGERARGQRLGYEQCVADGENTSWVTVAAMSFGPAKPVSVARRVGASPGGSKLSPGGSKLSPGESQSFRASRKEERSGRR